MARRGEFVQLVLELMAPLGEIRTRAMFGGYGIYAGQIIFAIVVDDRLFFNADDATRHDFAARGLNPLTYVARGRTITMPYYEAPPDVFESPEAMQSWAQQAVGAALRQKGGGKPVRRRPPPAPHPRRG